jgi:septal ring factor EnvC (AmiA/AmiB activator)
LKLLDKFFGKFRGKEEHSEYTLEELGGILKEDCGRIKKEAYSDAAPILEDIYASFDNIRCIALEIKELECPEDVNSRVKTVIRTAKPEFVREVLEALKGGRKGIKEDLSKERTAIGETMELLAKAVIGPGKYLHMAYAEDIDRIRKELKILAVKKKELEETAKGDNIIEGLIKEIESLKERLVRKNLLEKEMADTAKKLEALEKDEKSLAKEIIRIEEGNEYKEYTGKKEALQRIRCEKEEKENLVYNLLTPLKRPLKILRKSLEEKGKADASLKEIEKYADDPVNSFCCSESNNFMRLVSALKKSIDENPDLKPEEKSRVRQRISAIEGANLERIREDITSLKKLDAELSAEIERAVVQKKKTAEEKDLDRMRRDMARMGIEITRTGKKIEKESGEVAVLKQELEKKTSRLKNRGISVRLA